MYNYLRLAEKEAEFVPVGKLSNFASGDRWLFEIDGHPIALFRIAQDWYAIADICTHDEGPLGEGTLEGLELECPRHGGRFDLRTGKATRLPAVMDIPAYPVRVVGEEVQIGVPREAVS
ncbi:MAG: non-heme iron oxygenase ferredoxin subunit [Anaerolineales bacterium]|jgi:3-phenylpropionate/trans-cinnamate dioxygenase ferredoxin subunit